MLRVGILGVAHGHVHGYVHQFGHHPQVQLTRVWDRDPARAAKFAERYSLGLAATPEDVLADCDAVVICSENNFHVQDVAVSATQHKHILCEKPLITTRDQAQAMTASVEKSTGIFMTAFPCRYSPVYERLKQRVAGGDIGPVRAICATNRGRCPFDWFVDTALSGGGAMIDHVVHVTDLLRDLLGSEVATVQAQIGNNVYGQDWDDTAKLTLEFENGVFATLDSSWSRPNSYKTWGDVTLNVVGDSGVIELDLVGQQIDLYKESTPNHEVRGFSSDIDREMVQHFVTCCLENKTPKTTLQDGIEASLVAIRGYESAQINAVV